MTLGDWIYLGLLVAVAAAYLGGVYTDDAEG